MVFTTNSIYSHKLCSYTVQLINLHKQVEMDKVLFYYWQLGQFSLVYIVVKFKKSLNVFCGLFLSGFLQLWADPVCNLSLGFIFCNFVCYFTISKCSTVCKGKNLSLLSLTFPVFVLKADLVYMIFLPISHHFSQVMAFSALPYRLRLRLCLPARYAANINGIVRFCDKPDGFVYA